MAKGAERVPIFVPSERAVAASEMTAFTRYCAEKTGQSFPDHADFHAFSFAELEQFWRLFLTWSGLPYAGDTAPVCTDRRCESATFFPNLQLSYAANLLHVASAEDGDRPAL